MRKQENKLYKLPLEHWNIVRATYLIGGLFVAVSAILALTVDEKWLYFTIFVGLMFANFALTGYCPMAIFLKRIGVPKE